MIVRFLPFLLQLATQHDHHHRHQAQLEWEDTCKHPNLIKHPIYNGNGHSMEALKDLYLCHLDSTIICILILAMGEPTLRIPEFRR
jgi:hypothetical protein